MTLFAFTAGAVNGVLLGGLYALTAVGLAVIFGVMRLVNIPHGEFLVLGAYLSFFIATGLGLDPLLTVLIVAPVLFLIGYGIQRWLLHQWPFRISSCLMRCRLVWHLASSIPCMTP